MKTIYEIIKRPLVTERAAQLKADLNQYVFRVAPRATKPEIRSAVESLFKVKVCEVRTMNVRGKYRRMGAAPGSYRTSWKKAVVGLESGQKIEVSEEGQ